MQVGGGLTDDWFVYKSLEVKDYLVKAYCEIASRPLGSGAVRPQCRGLAYTKYCFTSHILWESIIRLLPPHLQSLPYCNTISRLLRNIRFPPPNPHLYAIHHTILVMAISCRGRSAAAMCAVGRVCCRFGGGGCPGGWPLQDRRFMSRLCTRINSIICKQPLCLGTPFTAPHRRH